MTLTDLDIARVAHLARVGIGADRVGAYRDDLERILSLFDQLARVDTEGVEPLAHPLELEQRLRADEVTEHDERERFQRIAPRVEADLYVVPKVIE